MVLRIVLLLPQSRQADLENPLKWTKNPPNALNLFIPEKSSFIFKSIAFFFRSLSSAVKIKHRSKICNRFFNLYNRHPTYVL